jgi:hypothetical protein
LAFSAWAAILASAAESVDALALMLWAKDPKEMAERAATATKVLMNFMVVFLSHFVWDGLCCPDVINHKPGEYEGKAEQFARIVQIIRMKVESRMQ